MSLDDLHPLFVGAYGENADLLERLLVDGLRDHVYWRRNFHPESAPPIPTSARYREDHAAFEAKLSHELRVLCADLKRSVPWFSPRYLGHMASDLLLPGLLGQMITTLYNPNNVSEDAAPATVKKEVEVGAWLATMFGYATDDDATPCAWGHLTSGGSVANYEGLRNLLAVRAAPLAMADAARAHGLDVPLHDGTALTRASAWTLVNQSVRATVELRGRLLAAAGDARDRVAITMRDATLDARGHVAFFGAHGLATPRVLVPTTAHYSWAKAVKLLGLGTDALIELPVDANMRLDVDALRAAIDDAAGSRVPVLAMIGVLGTTEFGTVDPIAAMADARDDARASGVEVGFHVDAAWGGYLASAFRRPDGRPRGRAEVGDGLRYFPGETVYRAFTELHRADSITVDPHKLGYLPYPAGAYVCRDRDMLVFVDHSAAYVFGEGDDGEIDGTKLRAHLGRYVLEGSKPGSSAAAAWLAHRVLPLHADGFGRVLLQTIQSCEVFWDRLRALAPQWADRVHVEIPFEPDSNLVCLALNPTGTTSAAQANAFVRRLYARMRVDPGAAIQRAPFIGSSTSLYAAKLPDARRDELCTQLRLDPTTLVADPETPEQTDHLVLLRHTLMNPWLLFEEDGVHYIDRYLAQLDRWIDEALTEG